MKKILKNVGEDKVDPNLSILFFCSAKIWMRFLQSPRFRDTDDHDISCAWLSHDMQLREDAIFRSVGKTQRNEQSSRSHFVFTLQISGVNENTEQQVQGVLNLIDLSRSERLSKSGAIGERLKETHAMNKSLSCLADLTSLCGNLLAADIYESGIPVVFSLEQPKVKLLPFKGPSGEEENPSDYQNWGFRTILIMSGMILLYTLMMVISYLPGSGSLDMIKDMGNQNTATITISAVEQLQVMASKRQHKVTAARLESVNQLSIHFEAYTIRVT